MCKHCEEFIITDDEGHLRISSGQQLTTLASALEPGRFVSSFRLPHFEGITIRGQVPQACCDCGKEKHGFLSHVTGCPAGKVEV